MSDGVLAQAKQGKAYDLGQFRILIVEDYPFMADLMGSMLKEFGVGAVLHAISGEEAKEMLLLFNAGQGRSVNLRSSIDLVIMDWLMPDGDGEDLLQWIRNNRRPEIHFLPTILCSAYANTALVASARDFGANEGMVKPLSAKKLAERILYVVDKPRPFVKTPDYFGPDRRRQDVEIKFENRRKTTTEDIKEINEQI